MVHLYTTLPMHLIASVSDGVPIYYWRIEHNVILTTAVSMHFINEYSFIGPYVTGVSKTFSSISPNVALCLVPLM